MTAFELHQKSLLFIKVLLIGICAILFLQNVQAQPPTVSVQNVACAPGDAVLTASGANTDEIYVWERISNNGVEIIDSNSATITDPNIIQNTTYRVRIENITTGEQSEATVVTVIVNPNLEIGGIPERRLCQGEAILETSVNESLFSGSISYQWEEQRINTETGFQEWRILTGETTATLQVMAGTDIDQGTYRVRAIFNGGCETISNIVQVLGDNSPNAEISADRTVFICETDLSSTIRLNSSPNSNLVSYQWMRSRNGGENFELVGTGEEFYDVTLQEVFDTPAIYKVRVISDDGACPVETQEPIEIRNRPEPSAIINFKGNDVSNGSVPLCENTTIILDASSDAENDPDPNIEVAFLWSDESGDILSEEKELEVIQPGTYRLRATIPGPDCFQESQVVVNSVPNPEVNISIGQGNQVACLGDEIRLDATITNGVDVVSYKWQLLNIEFINGLPVPVITDAPGVNNQPSYTINNFSSTQEYIVEVTSNNGCIAIDRQEISLNDLEVDVEISGETQFCRGESTTLKASPEGLNYTWFQANNEGDFIEISGENSDELVVTEFSSYRVRVDNGCSADEETIIVSALPAPDARISPEIEGNLAFCTTESVDLAPIQIDENASYQWDLVNGSNVILQSTEPNFTANQAGIYRLSVTLGSCTESNEIVLEAISLPLAQIIPSNTTFCPNETTTLVAEPTGANYRWFFSANGEGAFQLLTGETSQQLEAGVEGFYQLEVTQAGCSNISDAVQISPFEQNITAEIFTDGSNIVSVCDTTTLRAIPSEAANYVWQFSAGDGEEATTFSNALGGSNEPTYRTNLSGFYRVIITVNDCGVATDTSDVIQLINQERPIAEFENEELVFNCGEDPRLTAVTSQGTNVTYQLLYHPSDSLQTDIDNLIPNPQPDNSFSIQRDGYYRVRVTNEDCQITESTSNAVFISQGDQFIATIDSELFTEIDSTLIVVCPEDEVVLNASSGGTEYQWQFSPEGTSDGDFSFVLEGGSERIFTPIESGFYRVRIINDECLNSEAISNIVEVDFVSPSVVIEELVEVDSNQFFLCGTKDTLTFTVPQTRRTTYEWQFANLLSEGFVALADSLNGTNSLTLQSGTGFYRVVAKSDCLVDSLVSDTLHVFQYLEPQAEILNLRGRDNNQFTSCDTIPVTFRAAIQDGNEYQWYFSNTEDSTSFRPITGADSLTFSTFNSGFYRLEVISPCGLPSDFSEVVEVIQITSPSATILADPVIQLCEGENFELRQVTQATVLNEWFFANEIDASFELVGTDTSFIAQEEGFYYLSITDTICNFSPSISDTIQIIKTAKPIAEIQNDDLEVICPEEVVTLNALKQEDSFYQWFFAETDSNEFTPISNATADTLVAQLEGFYKVQVYNEICQGDSLFSNVIEVQNPIFPKVEISTNALIVLCRGDNVLLKGEITQTNSTFESKWLYSTNPSFNSPDTLVTNTLQVFANQVGFYQLVLENTSCPKVSAQSNIVEIQIQDLLTATIAQDTLISICPSSSTFLTSIEKGRNTLYQWQFAASDTSIFQNIEMGNKDTLEVNEAGLYRVQLRNTQCSNDLATSSPVRVIVNTIPEARILPTDTNICLNEEGTPIGEINLSAAFSQNSDYLWQYSQSSEGEFEEATGVNNGISYTTNTAGFYRVAVKSLDCDSTTFSTSVEVNRITPPTVSILGESQVTFCPEGGILQAEVNQSENFEFLWTLNGDTLSSTSNQLNVVEAGTYQVTLRNQSCTVVPSQIVNVTIEEAPELTLAVPNTLSICDTTNLSVVPTPEINYRWLRNGNLIAEGVSTITINQAGNYTVQAINSFGCTTSENINVSGQNLSFQIQQREVNCTTNVTFNTSANLEFSLNGSAFQSQPTFNNLSAGNYTVTVRNNERCERSQSFTVSAPQTPTISVSGNSQITLGDSIELSVEGNAVNYTWMDSSEVLSLSDTSILNPIAFPKTTTTYTVVGQAANGCTTTQEVTITVVPPPIEGIVPASFFLTNNPNAENKTWKIIGLEDFPQAEIQVFDRWGQAVFRSTGYISEWDGLFEGEPLPQGAYFYVISNLGGSSEVLKGVVNIFR